MNKNMMPKIVLNYKPNERRRLGRPLKGLLDEAGRGLSRLNSRHLMMMMTMMMVMMIYHIKKYYEKYILNISSFTLAKFCLKNQKFTFFRNWIIIIIIIIITNSTIRQSDFTAGTVNVFVYVLLNT
jgi:hypothetical protein